MKYFLNLDRSGATHGATDIAECMSFDCIDLSHMLKDLRQNMYGKPTLINPYTAPMYACTTYGRHPTMVLIL